MQQPGCSKANRGISVRAMFVLWLRSRPQKVSSAFGCGGARAPDTEAAACSATGLRLVVFPGLELDGATFWIHLVSE